VVGARNLATPQVPAAQITGRVWAAGADGLNTAVQTGKDERHTGYGDGRDPVCLHSRGRGSYVKAFPVRLRHRLSLLVRIAHTLTHSRS
jgi:hypothetical protein